MRSFWLPDGLKRTRSGRHSIGEKKIFHFPEIIHWTVAFIAGADFLNHTGNRLVCGDNLGISHLQKMRSARSASCYAQQVTIIKLVPARFWLIRALICACGYSRPFLNEAYILADVINPPARSIGKSLIYLSAVGTGKSYSYTHLNSPFPKRISASSSTSQFYCILWTWKRQQIQLYLLKF